jgi:hypothetical protein
MTEQHPGGVPENFDAFSRPEPSPDDTWIATTPAANPALYAPIDPYGIEDGEAAASVPTRPAGLRDRLAGLGRGKLIAGGVAAVLVVGGVVWGTSAALASSDSGSASAAPTAGAPQNPAGAAGKGAKKKSDVKMVRLKITSVAADSFVGTDAKGQSVTVAIGDDTHFGTKARPLTQDQLAVGMVVTVAGDRSGGSVDAIAIVPAKDGAASGGAGATPSAAADGNA